MFKKLVFFAVACLFILINAQVRDGRVKYYVDLNDTKNDLFRVKMIVPEKTLKSGIFNFPATAPGIYRNINFGKYVKEFKAFNKKGRLIPSEKAGLNQWKIKDPQNIYKVEYSIEDTYDCESDQPKVEAMSGTALEDEFVILNTFGVLGYFNEMQKNPVQVELIYNQKWEEGTSLNKIKEKTYAADNYDKLADSPLLLGKLSKATTKVNDINVDMYVYSPDKNFNAERMVLIADTILQSTAKFIGYSPVPRYTFLFCLIPDSINAKKGIMGGGALEHNESSLYYLPSNEEELSMIKDVMVHEFLHILTPLNVHSDFIHNYNFISPVPSKHVWFYEGVTEWASTIAQMRSGYKKLKNYLFKITDYLRGNDGFDKNYSLCDMSLETYTPKGGDAFGNFYMRGAVVAALLDIRLLELSDGKRGLRDLLLELVKEYGQNKFFKDEEFFDIIVKRTYPEIKLFIDEYICGTKPLPVEEYFGKLGIKYTYEKKSESDKPSLGTNFGMNSKGEIVAKGVTSGAEYGLQENDVITGLFDEKLTMENINSLISRAKSMKIDDAFVMKVIRNGEEKVLNGKLSRIVMRHIFEISEDATTGQIKLRTAWRR